MIAKISVLIICVEAIIYLLLYHLHVLYDPMFTQSLGLRVGPKLSQAYN